MTAGTRYSWYNPRLLLAVTLIFIAGAFAGALVVHFGLLDRLHQPAAYYPVGDKKLVVQQLTKELQLSPAQSEQLTMILDDFVMYVQMLQAQMDDVRASGKERILRVLDDRQKAKFEKMLVGIQQARRFP